MIVVTSLDNARYFLLSFRTNHDAWNHTIEAGIRTPAKRAEFIGVNTCFGNERLQLLQKKVVITCCCHNCIFYDIVGIIFNNKCQWLQYLRKYKN